MPEPRALLPERRLHWPIVELTERDEIGELDHGSHDRSWCGGFPIFPVAELGRTRLIHSDWKDMFLIASGDRTSAASLVSAAT